MKVQFISSTNPVFHNQYKNMTGTGSFNDYNQFFFSRSFSDCFHTSVVTTINLADDIITLKTMNSVYVFKLLEPLDSPPPIPITTEPITHIPSTETFSRFHCQLAGGFLGGVISTVTFPAPITKQQALELITSTTVLDDIEHHQVGNILGGIHESN